MADIKISELGAASAVNNTDLFPMTSAGVTVKATAQQIKNYMGVGNLSDLDTTDKSSAVAAINEVNTKVSKTEVLISNSGDAYSSSKAYAVGDLCIYDNKLYRCITACSAGSWATNQSCFVADTLTRITSEMNRKSNIKSINRFSIEGNVGNNVFLSVSNIANASQSISVMNGGVLTVKENGDYIIHIHISGKTINSTKRSWCRLMNENGNILLMSTVEYGDYITLDSTYFSSITSNDRLEIYFVEGIQVNEGSLGDSYIEIAKL